MFQILQIISKISFLKSGLLSLKSFIFRTKIIISNKDSFIYFYLSFRLFEAKGKLLKKKSFVLQY